MRSFVGHQDWVLGVQVSKDEKWLVSVSQDTTARVYSATTGECIHTLAGHTASVIAVAIADDCQQMFTASLDGTVKEWNIGSGQCISSTLCHPKGILALELVGGDGSSFVTASRDDTAARWVSNGPGESATVTTIYEGHTRWVTSAKVSGEDVFTGSTDCTARRWNLQTGEQLAVYEGHAQEVTSLQIFDGFLYTGSRESTARKFNISTGACVMIFEGHLSVVRDIRIYKGRFFTASADGTVKSWDLGLNEGEVPGQGKCMFTITGQGAAVTCLWVSNYQLFTGSSDAFVRQFMITDVDGDGAPDIDVLPTGRIRSPRSAERL